MTTLLVRVGDFESGSLRIFLNPHVFLSQGIETEKSNNQYIYRNNCPKTLFLSLKVTMLYSFTSLWAGF